MSLGLGYRALLQVMLATGLCDSQLACIFRLAACVMSVVLSCADAGIGGGRADSSSDDGEHCSGGPKGVKNRGLFPHMSVVHDPIQSIADLDAFLLLQPKAR